MVLNIITSTSLILAILDHYLSISKVLSSISRQISTIDLTWVLTQVISESAIFRWIATSGWVIRQSFALLSSSTDITRNLFGHPIRLPNKRRENKQWYYCRKWQSFESFYVYSMVIFGLKKYLMLMMFLYYDALYWRILIAPLANPRT